MPPSSKPVKEQTRTELPRALEVTSPPSSLLGCHQLWQVGGSPAGVPCTDPCPTRTGLGRAWLFVTKVLSSGGSEPKPMSPRAQEFPARDPAQAGSVKHSLSIREPAWMDFPGPGITPGHDRSSGVFCEHPRKGEVWGLWGRPELPWLGSHHLTVLPEPRCGGMSSDEKRGLVYGSWAAPETPPSRHSL